MAAADRWSGMPSPETSGLDSWYSIRGQVECPEGSPHEAPHQMASGVALATSIAMLMASAALRSAMALGVMTLGMTAIDGTAGVLSLVGMTSIISYMVVLASTAGVGPHK